MNRLAQTITNVFQIPELRRRILITLALLAVWRFGVMVPLPGINLEALKQLMNRFQEQGMGRLFDFLNIFSGGAITQVSLFSLGIMPYISASIIFSLLVKVIPSFEALAKEGPSGYRKISQYTRLATIPICVIQAFFIVSALTGADTGGLVATPNFGFYITSIMGLTAGTMFVMWLAEQISEYGIGNGASIIIMCGIIARMPAAVQDVYLSFQAGTTKLEEILFLVLLYVGIIVSIVITTQAQRRIPVQYAKHIRGGKVYGGAQRHYLPLRVNQANVMPVIFASALMALPALFAQIIGSSTLQNILSHSNFGFWYTLLYIGLVFFFSYFWTALYFQPNEMATQLQESGSFIPGIRPGKNTADHLEAVMYRVTLVGATFLCIIAIMPDITSKWMGVDRFVTSFLGGTGILIVVGVGLDMMQKIESQLIMRDYEGFFSSGRIRGRR